MGCGQNWVGWRKLKLNRRLHAGFVSGRHKDALHTSMAQLRTLSLQRVLAGVQTGEAVRPVPGGGCARLSAGGFIADNDSHVIQRRRMQVRELARKRSP